MKRSDKIYITLISLHGLLRGSDMELGRDADTGGQITYVVELAKTLGKHPKIGRVDLITRQIFDRKVDDTYSEPFEHLDGNSRIVRIPFGPRRYLRKEVLWPYLDEFETGVLRHFRKENRIPDCIHGHYADAGIAGSRLAYILGVPFVFTGHSLGISKKTRLLNAGMNASKIEERYNISTRINAEEAALDAAAMVVTSTHQEADEQYAQYKNYSRKKARIIPPGIDLDRFKISPKSKTPDVVNNIDSFLNDPKKPMILALARPDERKNLPALIHAFGRHAELRNISNLVIIAGNREDISQVHPGIRRVYEKLLLLVDKYDLYGSAAYPKHHNADDIPYIYHRAAKTRGVFVNPALTEPFGLTLIEAAASGLPIIATDDGGPRDIIRNCQNGRLIDALDIEKMGEIIHDVLSDNNQWQRYSRHGLRGVKRHYLWKTHTRKYVNEVQRILTRKRKIIPAALKKSNLPIMNRLVVFDIDNTLLGDREAFVKLMDLINESPIKVGFGLATGRRKESVFKLIREKTLPAPDLLISAVGSEIYYGPHMIPDEQWLSHIDYLWDRESILSALRGTPGLVLQPAREQRRFKVSYFIDPSLSPTVREIQLHLKNAGIRSKVIFSHGQFLDVLPIRASKGLAIRYISSKWALPKSYILVAGDSGNDRPMLTAGTLAVVVGNYSRELETLRG
ncbi:HAD-IIB family hydrolase, partial [bacterium]|nr:HAD-IIB family hydrolase [candidate division CSSED10-310 bacterium]